MVLGLSRLNTVSASARETLSMSIPAGHLASETIAAQ